MRSLLTAFINTLDQSMRRSLGQAEVGFAHLSLSQVQYLEAIRALGTPTITAIAARLGFSKASVTSGVNKLAGLGYVRKERSQADRRVTHVSLTDAGKRLAEGKTKALKEYEALILSTLTSQEVRQFTTILEKLVRQFPSSESEH